MRMEVEEISSCVKRHYGASVPIGGKGIFYEVVPSTLGSSIEFRKKLTVKLKVRTEPLWDSEHLVRVLIGKQYVLMEMLTED